MIKKPAPWEIALMVLALLATISVLLWRKSQADRDSLHHAEVMQGIEEMRSGVAPAAPVALQLNKRIDSHSQAALNLLAYDKTTQEKALQFLKANWQPSDSIKLAELLRVMPDIALKADLVSLLEKSGQNHQNFHLSAIDQRNYLDFKALLYYRIDPRLIHYFGPQKVSSLSSQIVWEGPGSGSGSGSGVALHHASLVIGSEASYLNGDDQVFGVVDKKAVAFPLRIMRWHHVVDCEVDNREILAVFDQRSATMAAFNERCSDRVYKFDGSCFSLYGEPLLHDQLNSLWSTQMRRPVSSDADQKDCYLEALPVVPTSWSKWKKQYPQTLVLSHETGFDRDYR